MSDNEKDTKQATCVDVTYVPGNHTLVQGVKNHEKPQRAPDGATFTPLGHGVGQHILNTQLILTVEVDGEHEEIRIGRYFKDNLGNLTQKNRDAIQASMPETVTIAMSGKYLSVDESDLNSWLIAAKEELAKNKKTK